MGRRGEVLGNCERIDQAFQKYVMDKMLQPARITLDDMANGFVLLAKPTEYPSSEPDFENVYTVFLSFVESCLLSQKRSSTFEICRCPTLNRRLEWFFAGVEFGKSNTPVERKDALAVLRRILEDMLCWSSENGITVRYVGERAIENWYHVLAEFEGCMSRAAFARLQSEMPGLLISIIQSVSLLQPCEEAIARVPSSELPSLNEKTLSDQRLFIHSCLDAFYSRPAKTKKDSIDKRIRNAIHLLMESDAQSNDALGLALSVTAMEAMLGEKKTEIAQTLAMDIAALLEPVPDKRSNAIVFVKKMYDLRSDALHGRSVEGEERSRCEARHLAAGILRGMISRRDFMRRSGYDPETPQDLLRDLREGIFKTGQAMGVDESNVRKLWDC